MNNDLTQTDSVISTRNPQGAQQTVTGPQARDFQPTASSDVLTQAKEIKVVSTGEPIEAQPASDNSPNTLLLVVAAVALIIAFSLLMEWFKKRPKVSVSQPVEIKEKSPVKKKKPSRAKRNQAKHR